MCVCVCVCVRACMGACVCVCVCTRVCVYVHGWRTHTHTLARTLARTHARTHAHTHAPPDQIGPTACKIWVHGRRPAEVAHTPVSSRTRFPVCMRACVCVCVRARARALMRIRVSVHTHGQSDVFSPLTDRVCSRCRADRASSGSPAGSNHLLCRQWLCAHTHVGMGVVPST